MKTNQNLKLLDGKKNKYNITLAPGGRGLGDTPSSVLRTSSPSRGEEGGKEEALNKGTFSHSLRSGFTLIELLVVVLIIGILAAVAVPQYEKAVTKARISNLFSVLTSVKQAEEAYYLENNDYSISWDELALTLPAERHPIYSFILQVPGAWSVALSESKVGVSVGDTRVPGVTILFFYDNVSHRWKGKRTCYAEMSNNKANEICQYLSGRKTPDSSNGPDTDNIYFLP